MQFERSYVICATPRTGSSLLCEALQSTGLAGRPKEYFSPEAETKLCKKWESRNFKEYFERALAEATTPNGVFGFKIMMLDFSEYLIKKLREIAAPQDQELPEAELLHRFFPDLRYIWITRRNKVRQAVSLSRAIQTSIWEVRTDKKTRAPQHDPRYRFNIIDLLMQRMVIHEARWHEYFAKNNIKPMIVFYEDFVNSYQETTGEMLKFIGLNGGEDLLPGNTLRTKQADQLSEMWVERFIREKAAAIMHV